jgi:hypothetical protein
MEEREERTVVNRLVVTINVDGPPTGSSGAVGHVERLRHTPCPANARVPVDEDGQEREAILARSMRSCLPRVTPSSTPSSASRWRGSPRVNEGLLTVGEV